MTRGITRAGFDVDLTRGEIREGVFGGLLGLPAGAHYLEVKSDERAVETGNIFLEYRQHGRPSGIAISDCYWWTTEVLPDVFVTMPTSRLAELGRRAYSQGRRAKGGDFGAFDGVLVPTTWLVLAP